MKNGALTVERIYSVTSEQVWKAITSKEEMKLWYFDLLEFRAEVGFEFQFSGGPEDGRQYLHICKITEVIPGKTLAYSWRYDSYEGDTLVKFELFPEGEQTRLRLTHELLDSFPAHNPDFAPTNFEAGWNWIIGKSLKEFLEKKSEKT